VTFAAARVAAHPSTGWGNFWSSPQRYPQVPLRQLYGAPPWLQQRAEQPRRPHAAAQRIASTAVAARGAAWGTLAASRRRSVGSLLRQRGLFLYLVDLHIKTSKYICTKTAYKHHQLNLASA